MTIVVVTPPAIEPISVTELMVPLSLDASNQEPPPGVFTVAPATPAVSGNVNAGSHRWLATFVTADGETQAGQVSAAVAVADPSINGKVALSAIPVGGALVTSRKLYRTQAGGSVFMYLATLTDNTSTTYTDNIADASLGAGVPTTNTTIDPYLQMLIASARASAETQLHRYLISQTLDLYLDQFDDQILLPPIQSVTSITYIDLDGSETTLASDQYLVDTKSQPARSAPAWALVWPPTRQQTNAVKVRFVAGYGSAADVPQSIKNWMLMRIKTLWDNRGEIAVGRYLSMIEIRPNFIDGLLDSERVVGRI